MANKVLGFTINIQGTDQAITTAEELRRAISEIQKELKKASDTKAIEDLEKKLIDLKARQAEVNAQVREQVKARRAELQATDAVDGSYSRLSKQLNDARRRYKDLAAAEQESTEEAQQLISQITLLDRRLKNIDASVGQFQRNIGGYTEALSQFFPRLGNSIGQVGGALQFAQGAAGGFNKALGVLALAVTVFQEVSAALNASIETAKEFNAVQRQIATTAQLTQEALEDSSGTVIAISRTYQEESRDIVNAANTITKEFGVGLPEALALIEAGFRRGANAQGDFLDQVREYPAQFAAAGGSASQFLDILIRAQQEGIYSDKGIDAVKEFGLRIREQTTATRGALENAFGERFTNELFRGINNGSITTVQALQRIGKGLQDTGLTAEQTQRVIADTFGGPGEDAGLRFLQLLGDIDGSLQDVTKSTNEYQTQQEKLFESNEALAQSQASLAEFTTKTSNEITILNNQFKILLNDAAAGLLRFVNESPATLKGLQGAAKSAISSAASLLTGGFIGVIQNPFKAYNEAYKVEIRKIKDQDEDAIKLREETGKRLLKTEAGLNQRLAELRQQRATLEIGSAEFRAVNKQIEEIEKQLRPAAAASGRKTGNELGEKFVEGSVAAIQKRKGELEKAIANTVAGSDAQKRIAAQLNQIEIELERAVQAQNRARLQESRRAELERLGQVQQIGTLVLNATVATEKQITDKVFEEVAKRANIRRKEITQAQQAAREQKVKQIEQIQQYTDAAFQLISAFTGRRAELEQREFEERIAATEANISALQARAQAATGLRQRLLQQQVAAQQATLAKQQAEAEAAAKKRAKQEKALALIQSIIQGALAVQRALATPPAPNIPLAISTGILAAVQTATIAAQPLATGGVVGISGRRVSDRQNIPTQSNGDNVLATVRRGEVVLNQRQQAALGGARTFRSIGVPGFRDGGPIGVPIGAPKLPAAAGADLGGAIQALDRKTDAINARLDRLRAFVVTEDIVRDIEESETIQIKATL